MSSQPRQSIYLIGFMGAGKSFTARKLGEYLQLPVYDLDDLLEQRARQSITDIFTNKGEAYFRALEASVLRETSSLAPSVIACGGGTPCFHENMPWMNRAGITIYLDVPENILATRLEKEAAHRPILQSGADIGDIVHNKLTERRVFYEQAQVHVRPDDHQTDLAQRIHDQFLQIIGH